MDPAVACTCASCDIELLPRVIANPLPAVNVPPLFPVSPIMQRIRSPFCVVTTFGPLRVPVPVVDVMAADTSMAPFHPCQSWTEETNVVAEPAQCIVIVQVPVLVALVTAPMSMAGVVGAVVEAPTKVPVQAPESVRVSAAPVDNAWPKKVTASPAVTLMVWFRVVALVLKLPAWETQL